MAYINGNKIPAILRKGDKGDNAFIRYSANADGTDFTEEWSEGQNYIGIATGQIAPTDKGGYTWSKFVGEGGETSADTEKRLTDLEKAVDDINYKEIIITSFSASPSTAEMGSKVTSVALSWGVNKTPTALTLDGSALGVNDKSKTVTGTFTANKSWKLKATDERGATAEKTASLSFLNGIYYGVSDEPNTYDSAFLLDGIDRGLNKTLRNSKLTSFSESAGSNEYIYYCLPKRMGTCSFKVGGFDGGFTLVDTIAFTNAFGYTEDYFIYRSDNTGLGQTTVTVS